MTIVTTTAAAVVERRLTSVPISERFAAEEHQRDQRERDPEREHHLAQDRAPSTG